MATTDSITVLKHSSVLPPPPSTAAFASEMSLPLTFLDIMWLHYSPIQRLILYEIPQLSKPQFLEQIIPNLEHSLSLTLQHFLPLAGNLIVPNSDSNCGIPEIRYTNGISSPALIIAESTTMDFKYLTANHSRNCTDFHPLIPELKPSYHDSGSIAKTTPVLALQVTLFQNCGMSIGISNHHTAGDACSIFKFMKTWASLSSKFLQQNVNNRDEIASNWVTDSPRIYDRTVIKDTKGLNSIWLDQWNELIKLQKQSYTDAATSHVIKSDRVRKSFAITRNHVEKLKNLALQRREKFVHLSSFTVTCAYVWSCIVKCRGPSGELVDDQELEHFACTADCRGRMDPPLPSNYFGNCITPCMTKEVNEKLIGEEGFVTAVELIGSAIHQRLKSSDSLFDGAETWMQEFMSVNVDRLLSVAGSPRYNYYNLDFGWGKPIKFEFISIENSGAISLNGIRDSDGEIEVGLALSKPRMDAFTAIFNDGLTTM